MINETGHRNEVNQGKCDLDDSILSRCEQGDTSSMGDKISLGEDMLRIDIIDQSSDFDGQVEKRLNDMVAIPHVPKINGVIPSVDEETFDHQWLLDSNVPKINGVIPSVDEETFDHQWLLDRLQLYGLVENKVQGDGNCQDGGNHVF
ncbi:hypothetical protein GOBAR_DD08583 [Gossypium barbadense]|nr:hypothetical protein GOBAR_DD08583 [Gossypium barbadense]